MVLGTQLAAAAEDGAPELDPGVSTSFGAAVIEEQLEPATDDDALSAAEDHSVEEFISAEAEDGSVVEPEDLEVGTLRSGDFSIVVVAPADDIDVSEIELDTDSTGSQVGFAAQVESDGSEATQAGPGMGTWQAWDAAWHSSVRLRIYFEGRNIGDGTFQTYKRKYLNDTTAYDSWQVARYGLGRSANDPIYDARVQKLWMSQNLTDGSFDRSREWLLPKTSPQEGFSNCKSGVALNYGPFSWAPNDCADYDVFMGRIAHHRLSMDQGTLVGDGNRAIAYTTGWTMDNNYGPALTWYEFVTLRVGSYSGGTSYKCSSTSLGPDGNTLTMTCNFGL